MYIERKENKTTGDVVYVLENGRQFETIHVVVDGKPVVADVVQADTEEGWVDVELPNFVNLESIDAEDTKLKTDGETPVFDPKIKRIVGEVKVYVDKRTERLSKA